MFSAKNNVTVRPAHKRLLSGHQAAFFLFFLGVLVLVGLSMSATIVASQPEMDMAWDTHSGLIEKIVPGSATAQAGLQVGDRILAVDGLSPATLTGSTNGKQAGEVLQLTVLIGGQAETVDIALRAATLRAQITRLVPTFIGLFFVAIGLGSYFLSSRQLPALLFACESLLVAGLLAAGTLSAFKIPFTAQLFNTCLGLVAVVGLHLHGRFPQIRHETVMQKIIVGLYGMTGLLSLILFLTAWGIVPWFAALQWSFRLMLSLSLLVQLGLLMFDAKSPYHRVRRHARLLIAGAVLGLAPFLLMALLPELLTGNPWWPYQTTFPFLLILPLAYGYTLARSRLHRWDRTVARIVTFFAVSIVLLSAYGLTLQLWEGPMWLPVSLALVGGLGFGPLTRKAQRWTDWVLFDIRYNYTEIISALSDQLARALDRPTMQRLLVGRLLELMPFAGAALFLTHEDGDLYLEPPASLLMTSPTKLSGQGGLAQALLQEKGVVTAEYLRTQFDTALLSARESALLRSKKIESWLPLAREGELFGILLLGPRLGGDRLDDQQQHILQSVAHQATLAAANVRLSDALRASRAEVAHAHGRLLLTRETERRQLAWSLHDGPVQDLLAISHRLAALSQRAADHELELTALRQAVVGQVNILRKFYVQLRPGTLDELGLREALRTLAFEFEDKNQCAVTFHVRGHLRHLPDVVAVTLFRVAQEALANVARHSRADSVALRVVCDVTCVTLIVMDDGGGFQVPRRLSALTKENHFGLLGMAERVELLGGTLAVQSEPGQGTTIQVWLPITVPQE